MTNPKDPGPNSSVISTCPSCASQSASALELDAGSWVVSCSNCGLVGPIADEQAQAVASWNLHPTPTPHSGLMRKTLPSI